MKRFVLPTLLFATPLVFADEIHMVDGTVYKDCTIDFETPKEVSFVVPISKSIKDTKTVARDQIKEIIKSTPDEVEIAKLERRYDDIASMTPEELKEGKEALDKFVEKYPKSKKLAIAQALQTKLGDTVKKNDEETAKAAAEAKANEPSEEEMKRFRFDIEANRLLDTMKAHVKAQDPYSAMQVFDTLKQKYSGSKAFVEAYPVAGQIAKQVQANLTKMIKDAEDRKSADDKKEREQDSKARSLTTEQKEAYQKKKSIKRAKDAENRKKYQEFSSKLREKRIRWYKPVPGYLPALEDLQRVAASDAEVLAVKLEDAMSEAGKATDAFKAAWENVDAKKFTEASEQLAIIRGTRVDKEYIEELDEVIVAGKQKERDDARAAREEEAKKRIEERRKQIDERRKKAGQIKQLEEQFKPSKDAKDAKDAPKDSKDDQPAAPAKKD